MSVPDLQLGIEFCEQAFPLHLIINEDLNVCHVSLGLKKLVVGIELGQNFQNFLIEESGLMLLDAGEIQDRMGDSFVFITKKNPDFRLHSGFYPVGNGNLLLVCSPIISNSNDIKKFALNFDDFSRHDPILNHISVVQTKDSTFNDIRALADRLEVQVEERTKELAESMNEAVLANRNKSEIMANMSHELRTPLNAIIGFSGLMMEETFGPVGCDKNREYLNDIHYSGQHLLELINDILDVSAIEAGAMELHEETINVYKVAEASLRLIKPRAESGLVTITSLVDPNLPELYVDERRVKQVILNLLGNAVKFTPEGGEVSINAGSNDDGSLYIIVSDNGIGMDEDELTKAMSSFGQVDSGLDRKHEGTGLGLPLTQGLMELHGGTLEVESEKGRGTKVAVTFPKERIVQRVR